MYQKHKNFPATYRAQEMKKLARWIWNGESGSVVGLSGCGRSNLLAFVCRRPEVLQSYLPFEREPIALVAVDLYNLPAKTAVTLYRVILRSFFWTRNRFSSTLNEAVTALYQEYKTTRDPFIAQSALYELFFAFQAEQTRVVLVLNRFDHFCQIATPQMLNTLRGLGDSFKDILCFIVGMRQEVAYLPDPAVLGDMYELLDSHICWVGAMGDADARWVIRQATQTASDLPDDKVDMMVALAGNFPVLLKAIGYWWLEHQDVPSDEWLDLLTQERNFVYRLARMWKGLTQEEQFALSELQLWKMKAAKFNRNSAPVNEYIRKLNVEHGGVLSRLVDKGVCMQGSHGWRARGALFADYVKRMGPSSRGRIRIDAKTEDLYQGLTPLRNLTPQEEVLLRYLIKHPHERLSYSDLLGVVYEGEAYYHRTRQDLFTLIRSLRKKIEVVPSNPLFIINYTSKPEGGYQFYPEGRSTS